MKKYCFILDTGSSANIISGENDTFVVPVQIIETKKNGETITYLDGVDFDREKLQEVFKKGTPLSTSQPSLENTKQLINNCLQSYEKVIFIPLSKQISGFYNTLKNIEKDIENLIVVDSGIMGIGGVWLRDKIDSEIKNNNLEITREAIDTLVKEYNKKWCGALIVSDLSRLSKSGRISKFKALISNLLKLKILMKFDGELSFESKDMNFEVSVSKALKLIDHKINYSTNGIKQISIWAEIQDEKINNKLINFIKTKLNISDYQISLLPIPVKLFAGPNTFSILIETK